MSSEWGPGFLNSQLLQYVMGRGVGCWEPLPGPMALQAGQSGSVSILWECGDGRSQEWQWLRDRCNELSFSTGMGLPRGDGEAGRSPSDSCFYSELCPLCHCGHLGMLLWGQTLLSCGGGGVLFGNFCLKYFTGFLYPTCQRCLS